MFYHKYLKYLISLHKTPAKIKSNLMELGIDITDEKIKSTKNELMLPEVFKIYADPDNDQEVDTDFLIDFAYESGFGEFWEYKLKETPEELEEMYDIIQNKEVRLIPLILALKGEEDVYGCMEELGYEYSKEGINLTLDLFFDATNIPFLKWKEYLPDVAVEYLEKPLDYIKHELGLEPNKSYEDILRDIMKVSYYKFKDLSKDKYPDKSMEAKRFADIAIKSGAKLKKHGTGDTQSFLDEVQVEFEKSDLDFKTEKVEEDDGQIKMV